MVKCNSSVKNPGFGITFFLKFERGKIFLRLKLVVIPNLRKTTPVGECESESNIEGAANIIDMRYLLEMMLCLGVIFVSC